MFRTLWAPAVRRRNVKAAIVLLVTVVVVTFVGVHRGRATRPCTNWRRATPVEASAIGDLITRSVDKTTLHRFPIGKIKISRRFRRVAYTWVPAHHDPLAERVEYVVVGRGTHWRLVTGGGKFSKWFNEHGFDRSVVARAMNESDC